MNNVYLVQRKNRNVIVSNAESKTDSSVQNETDVNITEDNTERTNNTLSIYSNTSARLEV